MTRRRWIADESTADTAALIGAHADHLIRVLRAEIGQQFDISTGAAVRRGTITAISNERVEFALGEDLPRGFTPQVTLLLAIFKFDRFEWAIEKCTEIGVAGITPIITGRTDTHLAAAASKRHDRWLRLARQAAEQSRRVAPPEIAVPIKLKDFSRPCVPPSRFEIGEAVDANESAAPNQSDLCIVLSESETGTLLRDVLASPRILNLTLAVGPEGGWTEEELNWFALSGWGFASLGETILRAETAAIVAAALALDALR